MENKWEGKNMFSNHCTSTLLLAFILLFSATYANAALDAPHNTTYNIGCLSCHDMASSEPKLLPPLGRTPLDLDDTLSNNVCWSCHYGPPGAPYVPTHSSLQADNVYGNWSVECWVCHNQHQQDQNRYNSSTYGKYIRRSINLAKITGLTKTGSKAVVFTGPATLADGDLTYNGVCEVCHTQTSHFRNIGNGTDQNHGNLGDLKGSNCTLKCHTHDNGFIHGGSNPICETCHNSGSHTTHISSTNSIGPRILCHQCHDLNNMPFFKSGIDGDANGKFSLAETDACDICHSKGGAFDGVDNAAVGAKPNWGSGVYSGATLVAGKEKWCVTCHDLGTSVIGGRQAPDVAGDNTNYGYYTSGHGRPGAAEECSACHGVTMMHNFDNKKTYAGASNNYKQGFRLSDVGGMNPLTIPYSTGGGYNANAYKLCFTCHDAQSLLSDTKSRGCYDNTSNPYKNAAAITTQFRNIHPAGHDTGASDIPANFHADHLIDVNSFGAQWYSDGPGVTSGSSAVSCPTCHNPHGGKRSDGSPTIAMTVGAFEMVRGTDATGQFGEVTGFTPYVAGDPQQRCNFNCHWDASVKWYYNAAPTLNSIAVADRNNADPAAAEAGFTNNTSINVTLSGYGSPTQIMCAEDNLFTINPTPWDTYASPYTYTMTVAQGNKAVYCKTRNAHGESAVRNAAIVLDTSLPTIQNTTLTAPIGAEVWAQGTSNNITWTSGDITDANLKASPLTLSYSTNSGTTFPNTIATGIANSGTYSWLTPLINQSAVRVRVTATDKAGNQASDQSDGDLTIQAVTATIGSFTLTDSNPANPAPAEAGYTNGQTVNVAITASNYPTEMRLAEDGAFTLNATGWIAYSASTTYTLSSSEGAKTVWLQLRNAAGESGTSSYAITLDTTAPGVSVPLNSLLTAPNGSEQWQEAETTRQITWNSGSLSDTNLKPSPITLEYSVDAGITFPYTIVTGRVNSGTYAWNPIPKPASYSTIVRLKVTDRAGNQIADVSDANFIIKPLSQYIVTNTNDSGAGSLRQAITNLVAAGGNNAIWFNIPAGSLTNNVAVINLTTILPNLARANMTIDGGSQAVLSGIANPRGPSVRLHGNYSFDGFAITADRVTIRKLQLTNFYFYAINVGATGTNAVIEGNHIGFRSDSITNYTGQGNDNGIVVSAADCRIGGSSLEQRNFISNNFNDGIYLSTSTRVTIDNNLIGLTPDGVAMSNGMSDYAINALYPHNGVIKNNMISGSLNAIYVDGPDTLAIKGNIFGLYFDGTTWFSRTQQNIPIRINSTSARNITIGGPTVATNDNTLNDSNVFSAAAGGSGINGSAIYVYHNNTFLTKIYGNFIGTNPEQDEIFPGRIGVYLTGFYASYTVIGGSGAGEAGNVIANMSAYGTYLVTGTTNVKISRNSFYNNGTSAAGSDDAIFLEGTANNSITRPTITAANTSTITVGGVVSGDVVQVYLSDYDGSGTEYGEGRIFIGSNVAAGTSVDVDISAAAIGSGVWVTALRKDANNNTSAFSANILVP